MKKRTLIILVAILVLLYLVGTGVTLGRKEPTNDEDKKAQAKDPPGWMGNVDSLLDGPGSLLERGLTEDDILRDDNACWQQFRDRLITSDCIFTVEEQGRFRRTRVLKLRRQQGNPRVRVKITVSINGESASQDLERKVEEIPVHRSGGTIAVNCSGPCAVQIRR